MLLQINSSYATTGNSYGQHLILTYFYPITVNRYIPKHDTLYKNNTLQML